MGYAVEEVLNGLRPDETYDSATHGDAGIDFLLFQNGRRIGVECQRADTPVPTPSLRLALADLTLDELRVVYPGEKLYALAKQIEVAPLSQLVNAQ